MSDIYYILRPIADFFRDNPLYWWLFVLTIVGGLTIIIAHEKLSKQYENKKA